MRAESHRFKVGSFECIAVTDGTRTYQASDLFINASKGRLGQVLREYTLQPDQVAIPYTCLVINAGEHRVLVDTGLGANVVPDAGKLLQNLQAEGIEPEDINTVVLTHGHRDHIGGNIDSQGKPTFPNARYIMWKDEWDFWTSETNLAQRQTEEIIPFVRIKLLPIQDQLDLIDHEMEILPGIHAVPAPGHTPGHMVLTISSDTEQLLYISDALIHPIHLQQPDWYSLYDIKPEQAVATKRQLLDRVVAEKALVFAFHFPFPGLGYVIQKGKSWQWQPTASQH
jgi:glyoxylase-like metal-dependent hydrolase (beta-lactamase superfamily II)